MSSFSITNYYNELEKIVRFGGSKKETAIRNAFYYLLNDYAKQKDLMLVAEISTKNKQGKIITPDGTLKDYIRNDWGYWESKDESDDINEEIIKKFGKGYPSDNILFEDSQTAVLYQHGDEVLRVNMREEEQLNRILHRFINYERPEVHDFREAIEKFKEDIPKVTEAIRFIIAEQEETNAEMKTAQEVFLKLCQMSINPAITKEDVTEMMIQHILSADIFNTIFDEPHFHQENNIASELNRVVNTFFTGNIRRQTLGGIKHYYDTINARAAGIADHHEKQKFLKVVYENFYKGYNPKAADRLGIVYTPNEIVQFMIKSTDYLLHKHFGKTLGDKNVDILDPATGTGTFICDIIDYLPAKKLKEKYKSELHANEVAILPYYIANLNIEYTYKQKMGEYAEFENLCFVDTLDNTGFNWIGKQGDLFGVSAENAQRIKRQNERKISVVIGNPPYNANQQNENDNNKNCAYPEIDKRIKDTYIKNSTAQKTKLYDMYSRFYRWAMDRLNDNGIIAFITNRSFIDSRTFDGFRKTVQDEYDFAYIIDTKSDVRANPKIAGTTHNVFGIQAGVAVLFLVKASHKQVKTSPCKISYVSMEDNWLKEQKLNWFTEHELEKIDFENVTPDKNNNWINITDNDWDKLIPVCTKDVKAGKNDEAIFALFTNGIVTNRDSWVYDFEKNTLKNKMEYFVDKYNANLKSKIYNNEIKWSRDLKNESTRNRIAEFGIDKITTALYRPFVKSNYYSEFIFSDMLTNNHYEIFGKDLKRNNIQIGFLSMVSAHQLSCLVSDTLMDLCLLKQGNGGTQCLPLYRYDKAGNQTDNITDWALNLFREHYFFVDGRMDDAKADKYLQQYYASKNMEYTPGGEVLEFPMFRKDDIFDYVYAVLHNPAYRKKYELNLKREFPRIPLYDNFLQWAAWGQKLMSLHIGYEKVAPYPLKRTDIVIDAKAGVNLDMFAKGKLKANKAAGTIVLDAYTEMTGIPPEAWEYKLGNRSALEWVLDQYKEKKPSDPTIAEKFNTYKFSDHKDHVIDLLQRVCTVSVETMKIVREMEEEHDPVIASR